VVVIVARRRRILRTRTPLLTTPLFLDSNTQYRSRLSRAFLQNPNRVQIQIDIDPFQSRLSRQVWSAPVRPRVNLANQAALMQYVYELQSAMRRGGPASHGRGSDEDHGGRVPVSIRLESSLRHKGAAPNVEIEVVLSE
jgi:hypothetical protein